MTTDPDPDPSDARSALARASSTGARWFGGKGRPFAVAGVRRIGSLGGPPADGRAGAGASTCVTLAYADDPRRGRVLPAAARAATPSRRRTSSTPWSGAGRTGVGPVHAYDALHDRDAMALLLAVVRRVPRRATSHFQRLPGHDLDLDTHSTLFTRRAVELLGRLRRGRAAQGVPQDHAGPQPRHHRPRGAHPGRVRPRRRPLRLAADRLAWSTARSLHLAMLQQFLRTASDGWDLALASVRNLFAEGDLHADEVGGDFAGEAARLGRGAARGARDAGRALPDRRPQRRRAGRPRRRRCAPGSTRRWRSCPSWPSTPTRCARSSTAVGGMAEVAVQQIHGDLHLGQTLRTVAAGRSSTSRASPPSRWPSGCCPTPPGATSPGCCAPSTTRRGSSSARSPTPSRPAWSSAAFRADEWASRNRTPSSRRTPSDPLTSDEEALLAAYVADKAVYEAVYEARNRPAWVAIPLAALARAGSRMTTTTVRPDRRARPAGRAASTATRTRSSGHTRTTAG